jgi:phospholipid/cholesterol/gamma-HCH transport system substrate-binding protein
MERNANYALVGLISTSLMIGILIFVVWLAGASFNRGYNRYDVVFQGPVSGLSKGAEVHFNGIKVGDVTDINLDPRDPHFVIARARVTTDVPIRTDSYATLEPEGITGVNYVQITAGTATRPLLIDTVPPGGVPRLGSRSSAISSLLAGGGTVVQRTVELLDRANRVLSDDNIRTLGATLSDVQAVTAELRQRKSMIADAQKTLQSTDQAAQEIRDLAHSSRGLVDDQGKKTLTKLGDAADQIDGAAKDLRGVITSLKGPTSDFAENGLPRITDDLASLKRATDDLDRVLQQIQANPRGLVAKGPAREAEVKP